MEGAHDQRAQRDDRDDTELQERLPAAALPHPVSNFYEWTGAKGHKTKWDIRVVGKGWFCFAGIWDKAETADGVIESYALATMAPEP